MKLYAVMDAVDTKHVEIRAGRGPAYKKRRGRRESHQGLLAAG